MRHYQDSPKDYLMLYLSNLTDPLAFRKLSGEKLSWHKRVVLYLCRDVLLNKLLPRKQGLSPKVKRLIKKILEIGDWRDS